MKLTTAAVIAVVATVVLGAAGAIAASGVLSGGDERQAILDDAAARLGVKPSELADALQEALKGRVDAAVESGHLTEEQGRRLKDRIDAGEVPFLFGGLGVGHFGDFGHMHVGNLDAAATYLGLDEAELRERLADGKTLADIAKAEGRSVDGLVRAMVAEAKTHLDDAVADGRLTRAQADELAQGIEERVRALVNGDLPAHGIGPRLGPPFGMPFGDRSGEGWQPHGAQA